MASVIRRALVPVGGVLAAFATQSDTRPSRVNIR
jgi:hypothetical protein